MTHDIEPRPRQLTPELRLIAAKSVVERLLESRHLDPSEADQAARDIAKEGRGRYTDGYSLAKDLEDYHGWSCNFAMSEILNDYSMYAADQLRAAEMAWAERVKPEPPFEIGTHIRVSEKETGVIDAIYKHGVAQYSVKVDGDSEANTPTQRRLIINFEDAQAIEHATA